MLKFRAKRKCRFFSKIGYKGTVHYAPVTCATSMTTQGIKGQTIEFIIDNLKISRASGRSSHEDTKMVYRQVLLDPEQRKLQRNI